jgi:hypothetical protein
MSSLGHECDRALWLGFRLASNSTWQAGTIRKFEDGHRGEDLMADRLRAVKGITIGTIDPETGQQFRFTDHGGHLSGHMDGWIKGLLQAPATAHVWEHKVTEKFNDFYKLANEDSKSALAKWNFNYFVQAQMYMHYTSMNRHYITVDTPGGRMSASARTDYDKGLATQYIARAKRIIESKTIPAGVSKDPSWWQCRGCQQAPTCHGDIMPRMNCRTCAHSTPVVDDSSSAKWKCEKHNRLLSMQDQLAGCADHVFIPEFFTERGYPVVDSSVEENWISYQFGVYTVANGTKKAKPLVVPSDAFQHVPPPLAEAMLGKVFDHGFEIIDPNAPKDPNVVILPGAMVASIGRSNDLSAMSKKKLKALLKGQEVDNVPD